MLVYKKCKTKDGKNCIVTLRKSSFTESNEDREFLVDPVLAQYRCKEVEIVKIEDMKDESIEYDEAFNYIYNLKIISYKVGQKIVVDDYDEDKNKVCSTGIHYYFDKDMARSCDEYPSTISNGIFLKCHDNGEIIFKYKCENGKINFFN